MMIFEIDSKFYLEEERSSIPWVKLFTKTPYQELSELPKELRYELWEIVDIIEKEMIAYYTPEKINIASFGNMIPHVHVHIMARFENDTHFPNSMWGEQLREDNLQLPDKAIFYDNLRKRLEQRR